MNAKNRGKSGPHIGRSEGACNMADVTLLYSTAPDVETAQKIADTLVTEKLAACVNILAPMTSVYEWDGALEHAGETPMIVKTANSSAAKDRIIALHPYDCPCVIALNIDEAASSAPFLEWVRAAAG